MSQTIKTIRGIDTETINLIDARASELNVTSNELIREVLKDYAKNIQEVESSVVLHAYIDDLIEANNRLIQTQNQNTLVIGQLAKKIIERLDFYLPKMELPEE
ncbi:MULTISPECIES: hypothetical protein [Leuconostoc]|uniref:hypothetical protein n=1 Tax=Leuconostoc TaxID=1243 RepID=UPI000246610E|nr:MULTISPECIES: hypothetical protein [Leuconostoc]MBA5937991.1 hypothetical protein [Leuconostoc citreum]MDV8932846.1 hypothetical protein [Leuconostoc citreum]QEA55169.1 hypothetical protein FGL76_03585 [Leuconostoc citreum]QOG10698.1 hypothetical protein FAZ25_07545 [Leuconostoc sp. LN180020]CCF25163.1 Putative uncharacterized protein [Leuconostoc citreum LBAE C10]